MAPEGAGKQNIWEILKSLGGVFTALAIALVGYFTSSSLEKMKAAETRAQLYAELMSKREEAESALRKDMFVSIIQTFLQPAGQSLDAKVLNLELLAYNFHEALNLKPLFIHIAKQVYASHDPARDEYQYRLERVAKEVTRKQRMVLEGAGASFDRTVDFDALAHSRGGLDLDEAALKLDGVEKNFRLRVLETNTRTREMKIRLEIAPTTGNEAGNVAEFWVGFFDFPMIDNVRLLHDQRCAVVMNNLNERSADLTVIYFPGSYASLKEKPYFQEVVHQLLSDSSRR